MSSNSILMKQYTTIFYIILGYDTAAHVAEETTNSHETTPFAMIGSVVNCLVLGNR